MVEQKRKDIGNGYVIGLYDKRFLTVTTSKDTSWIKYSLFYLYIDGGRNEDDKSSCSNHCT